MFKNKQNENYLNKKWNKNLKNNKTHTLIST